MNAFLEKHGVDVGKVSSILLWSTSVDRVYAMLVGLLIEERLNIRIDALFTVIFAIAMWQKLNWARITLIVVFWVVVGAVLAGMLAVPFMSHEKIAIVGRPYSLGLYVRMWILVIACLPITWACIAALSASKTKREFAGEKMPSHTAEPPSPSRTGPS